VRFRINNKGDRVFRLTAKAPGADSEVPVRDTVDFDARKIAPRLYQIDLGKGLGKGEYGILPPLDAGSTSKATSQEKIYTFSAIE
jgi:hypothetical protein